MKVFLDYKKLHTDSGKSKFLKRLIPELEKIGVSVRFKPKDCDIALGISKWRTDFKGMPKCLRVDGIHLSDTKEAKWRNEQIRKAIKHSDGVIWQSMFARDTIMKKLKVVPKKAWVIYNGASYRGVERSVAVPHFLSIIIVGNWGKSKKRKFKRLKETIKFAEYYCKTIGHAEFTVIGETDLKSDIPEVQFLGKITNEDVLNYWYQSSDLMLTMADYCWCDNAVVEARCAELPVIATSPKGFQELDCEIILDKNLLLVNRLNTIAHKGYCGFSCNPKLFIENVAKRYKKAFEECLQ